MVNDSRNFGRDTFIRMMKHIPEETVRAAEVSSVLEHLSKVDGLIAALESKERGEFVSEEVLLEAHQLARAYVEGKGEFCRR